MILVTDAQQVKQQLDAARMPNRTRLGRLYEDLWSKMLDNDLWKVVYASFACYASYLASSKFFFSIPNFLSDVIAAELRIV